MGSLSLARRGFALGALSTLLAAPIAAGEEPAPRIEPSGAIRLGDAEAAALRAHPDLAAAAGELRAREAGLVQAGLRPNPELSLEVEDVAGTDAFGGARHAQTTLRVLQAFELGGERGARRDVAARGRDLASLAREARRLDVLAETSGAFVDVLVAQEELHHAAEMVGLSKRTQRAAAERVQAGAAPAVEETRARLAFEEARLHEAQGRRGLEVARLRLAATWNGDAARFERADGDLDQITEPPPLASLLGRLADNPDLARFELERGEREAALALARARRVPDLRLGAGLRHLAGPDDAALVFEAALPVPLWDRSQGAIAEAAERVAKLASERAAAQRRSRLELIAAHDRWLAADAEVRALRTTLLPGARRALEELREAYASGRIAQLDVLEAQRARFEAIDRLLHALSEHHHARTAAARLVGESAGAPR